MTTTRLVWALVLWGSSLTPVTAGTLWSDSASGLRAARSAAADAASFIGPVSSYRREATFAELSRPEDLARPGERRPQPLPQEGGHEGALWAALLLSAIGFIAHRSGLLAGMTSRSAQRTASAPWSPLHIEPLAAELPLHHESVTGWRLSGFDDLPLKELAPLYASLDDEPDTPLAVPLSRPMRKPRALHARPHIRHHRTASRSRAPQMA